MVFVKLISLVLNKPMIEDESEEYGPLIYQELI
jgi:hypothetical protein